MIAPLTVSWTRLGGHLGRISMYRLVVQALGALALAALALSFLGLVVPAPLELLATAAVLITVCLGTNAALQRALRMPVRSESSLITAGILLFVLRPTLVPLELVWIAIGGATAVVSKYAIAWRGRHILNPAAVGATVLTVSGLASSAWWVGAPALAGPVLVLGLAVLVRTERLRMVSVFLVLAVATSLVRVSAQSHAAGLTWEPWQALGSALWSSPFLFLGAFMLSEPLTMPPRRWQQLTVAAVVGVLAGWPISIGEITLGQERALLIGNLFAFIWALHHAVRLRLADASMITPTVRQLTFEATRPVRFAAGQYVELEVPHAHPDARGTRRPFSIVSAPSDAPLVRIAYRVKEGASESSFKRALGAGEPGVDYAATGVWGDFVLPRRTSAPVLLVAAGIGVTPFVSQLREASARGERRDVVLVYVVSRASELAFRDELAATGAEVIVFSRDDPSPLPARWRWARDTRLDAEGLLREVPDLPERHAYVSGPPALVADLASALERARSLTTDAFAGY